MLVSTYSMYQDHILGYTSCIILPVDADEGDEFE